MVKEIALDKPGYKALLLGNEAIARGAIEGGVNVATAYPGTPSTEIVETLARVANDLGIYVEWSVNEKVALEVAFAASICGLRSLTAMKHVGVNVALDSLMSLGYTGVIGGFILVSAEDPYMHSSQNEQDNRWIGLQSYIPVFEPYNQQEAKDLIPYMFDFSEKFETPLILRSTTRLSHTRGIVEYGVIKRRDRKGVFNRDIKRWVLVPSYARIRRKIQLERWQKIRDAVEHVQFNRVEGSGSVGIIAVGTAYGYLKDAIRMLNISDNDVRILKLTVSVPVPIKLIEKFIDRCEKVLIIEELEGVVETQIKSSLYGILDVPIHGKDVIGYYGELSLSRVLRALANFLGIEYKEEVVKLEVNLPSRPPILCPGCPHRATFFAIRKAVNMARVKAVYPGDIGCYTLAVYPPYEEVDTTISMGSGIGIGNGLAHFQDNIPIVTIGDSTFYHAGISGLINAVYNNAPLLLIVLDNGATAMTGYQPSPVTGYTAMGKETKRILAEDIAKGIGVEKVLVVDPYDLNNTVKSIREAIEYVRENKKPAVIVARRLCSLEHTRRKRLANEEVEIYHVDTSRCTGCGVCINYFACPAIHLVGDKAEIDEGLCMGCGVCAQVCPYKAIVKVEKK